MEQLIYLGKVNLCWMLFYACYWLVLRRHTFFQWNRAYLLVTLLVSFALPALTFGGQAPVIEPVAYVAAAIPVYIATPASESYFSHWTQFFWMIQGLGAAFMLSKMIGAIRDLRKLLREGETIAFDHYTLVLLPHNDTGSFSFLNRIVVNRNDYENHFDLILSHETVHIQQKHSVDILLIELLKVVFWFNPALWLYKRSLQEVHEFLADEQASNRDQYTQFLVSYALNSPVASLTNHFFNSSLLLNRVQMIYKNRNSYWSLSKYLIIVPVVGMLMLLTGARERFLHSVDKYASAVDTTVSVEGTVNNTSHEPVPGAIVVVKGGTRGTSTDSKGHFKLDSVAVNSSLVISHINYVAQEIKVDDNNITLLVSLKNAENSLEPITVVGHPKEQGSLKPVESSISDVAHKIFTVVEQQPEFPGGQAALGKYLSQNIIYPAEALENKTQGEVTVSFIVNEKGYVRAPTVLIGLGDGIDEEAIRVVLNMPKWNPGIQNGHPVPVKYTMPIKFALGVTPKDETDKSLVFSPQREMPDNMRVRGSSLSFNGQNPLIVIDRVKQKWRGDDGIKTIKPENIESISVLKGRSATSAYGDEGKDGVIMIKTKK